MTRERKLVILLGAVLAVALYYWVSGSDGGPAGGSRASAADVTDEIDLPSFNLASLRGAATKEDFNPGDSRNLFAYYTPPRPAPPKPVQLKTPPRPQKKPPKSAPPPSPSGGGPRPRAPKQPPPGVDFTYLGYMGPYESRFAVFKIRTEDGEDVTLVREGEILLEKFRLNSIGFEQVEIGYTEEKFADESTTLPMGG